MAEMAAADKECDDDASKVVFGETGGEEEDNAEAAPRRHHEAAAGPAPPQRLLILHLRPRLYPRHSPKKGQLFVSRNLPRLCLNAVGRAILLPTICGRYCRESARDQ